MREGESGRKGGKGGRERERERGRNVGGLVG